MTRRIFINYRRGDDPGFAQALYGRLEHAFPSDNLFIDIDSIEPGLDFIRVLEEQVASCDVVLAVIGRGWLNARDEAGARRLDNPGDYVRIEIASAFANDKRVIPVLIGDAPMPRSDQLPDALKPLARRHAVRLTHERFKADTEGLIHALRRALESAGDMGKLTTPPQQQIPTAATHAPIVELNKESRKHYARFWTIATIGFLIGIVIFSLLVVLTIFSIVPVPKHNSVGSPNQKDFNELFIKPDR
jgi:TIR domain